MTKQEAEVLAAKLTRIWAPGHKGSWTGKDGKVGFFVDISSTVRFECIDDCMSYPRDFGLTLSLNRYEGEVKSGWKYRTGHLYCFSDVGDICITHSNRRKDYGELELFQQFAQEWTPFFRRGCWLSGCPIEASAHEKTEWIQGFTREEIEAWNLKM